jgi:hypothetical protein
VYIGLLVRYPIIMAIINSTATERIVHGILSTYDGKILAITIMDTKGISYTLNLVNLFQKNFESSKRGLNTEERWQLHLLV